MKIIKQILIDGIGWIYSKDGQIEVFDYKGPYDFYPWYRQGNREFNSIHVMEVEYEK